MALTDVIPKCGQHRCHGLLCISIFNEWECLTTKRTLILHCVPLHRNFDDKVGLLDNHWQSSRTSVPSLPGLGKARYRWPLDSCVRLSKAAPSQSALHPLAASFWFSGS